MSGITQAVVDAAMIVLEKLFSPIEGLIESYGPVLLRAIVGTPHPDRVFGAPANGPWPGLHQYYWESIVPLSLGLYGLALGLVILLETTSHLFSGYHTSRLKKRAFVGLLGILSWWWLASFALTLVSGIAGFLLPDLSDITLFQTISFSGIGVIGLVLSLSVDLSLFVLLAVIYLLRQLVLYLYVLLMPILIALWIPGVGPFGLVAQFMKRLAGLFVPFLFMTLPVALLFRLGGILGDGVSLSLGGIGQWLTALVIPILALITPFVMVWQAGALFFMLDRAGRKVSRGRVRERIGSMRNAGGQARYRLASMGDDGSLRERAAGASQRVRDLRGGDTRSGLGAGLSPRTAPKRQGRAGDRADGDGWQPSAGDSDVAGSRSVDDPNGSSRWQTGADLLESTRGAASYSEQTERTADESGREGSTLNRSDVDTLADRIDTDDTRENDG